MIEVTQKEGVDPLSFEVAFRFLLDHEPRESVLGEFDVSVISRYFPEFEQKLPEYLSRS